MIKAIIVGRGHRGIGLHEVGQRYMKPQKVTAGKKLHNPEAGPTWRRKAGYVHDPISAIEYDVETSEYVVKNSFGGEQRFGKDVVTDVITD